LPKGDKHKANLLKRRVFAFLAGLTYDLEPLSPELDILKSGRGSLWGDKHKTSNPERRSLPFWVTWLMTSSPKPLELDM
jgi:hypothetical protein